MNTAFEQYQAEAKEKWGQTPAYAEYTEKTKNHSKETWNDLAVGMDGIMEAFSLAMQAGDTPDSPQAQSLVQRLQSYITENYYLCTKEILAGLGQMYVADDRFKQNIDKHAPGTAAFISRAIKTYCEH